VVSITAIRPEASAASVYAEVSGPMISPVVAGVLGSCSTKPTPAPRPAVRAGSSAATVSRGAGAATMRRLPTVRRVRGSAELGRQALGGGHQRRPQRVEVLDREAVVRAEDADAILTVCRVRRWERRYTACGSDSSWSSMA